MFYITIAKKVYSFNQIAKIYFLRKVAIFFLLFSFFHLAYAENIPKISKLQQDIYARFTHFSPKLGSGDHKIVDIQQDKYGYIWLAGAKGLFRFDGNIVRHYVNDWTPGSLPSSKVYCLETDTFGRLWIGTENGLCIYDYRQDLFKKILGPDTLQPPSDTFYIRTILAEGDSLLWVDTQQGYLWKINSTTLKVIHKYQHPKTEQPYYHYNAIFRNNANTLWIGGRGRGPYILHEKTGLVSGYPNSNYKIIQGLKRGNDVAYFYKDSHGNFWIGSTDGIYLYDKNKATFHLFYKTSSWAMVEDYAGDLWFAISSGLGRFHPETGKMTIYLPNEEDKGSLVGNNIIDLFEDNYHQLWIATGNGVSVFKPENPGVQYLFHIPGVAETPASSAIAALALDSTGSVWIGSTHHGIDQFDPSTQTITHFNTSNTKNLPSNNIRSITISPNGDIYCGLWAGVGFGLLQPKNRQFRLFTFDKTTTNSDWYNDMVFDKKGDLYLGFWGGEGLVVFDPIKRKFDRFLKKKFRMFYYSRLITCLEMDTADHLWMGTTNTSLHLYLPEKDTSLCFYSKINPDAGIDEKKIYCIAKDHAGTLWVGAKGLYRAFSGKQKVEKIILNERLKEIKVFGLLVENPFSIWLLSDKGLLLYNHQSKSVIDYSSTVTLSFLENNASGIKLKSGKLLFAGRDGMAIVDPSKVKLHNRMPSVFLSSLLVFDKVKIPNLENQKNVSLKNKENFFTIQIGSNVWGTDDLFQYFYKLDGFDKNWIPLSPANREAHFTNVPPGDYSFRIKVEDKQGNRYPDVAECAISIIPPFWIRWWFIALTSLLVFSIILFLSRMRFKSVKLALLNSELDQKLLRLQMNPHFIFNSLFAIQNFIYSHQTHLAGNYLSDFAQLIRLILDNSRKETIHFEKELKSITLYLKLQKLRFEDKFDYFITVDPELTNGAYEIPPMLAQPFLENAIEHGMKNLNRKGEIRVHYHLLEHAIRLTVTDNGIGLTASSQNREDSARQHESLAISICKKRLEILHRKKKGRITFMLEEIKHSDHTVAGTKVAFNIPIYSDNEKV